MEELEILRGKSPQDLWIEDLDAFLEELEVCLYSKLFALKTLPRSKCIH